MPKLDGYAHTDINVLWRASYQRQRVGKWLCRNFKRNDKKRHSAFAHAAPTRTLVNSVRGPELDDENRYMKHGVKLDGRGSDIVGKFLDQKCSQGHRGDPALGKHCRDR